MSCTATVLQVKFGRDQRRKPYERKHLSSVERGEVGRRSKYQETSRGYQQSTGLPVMSPLAYDEKEKRRKDTNRDGWERYVDCREKERDALQIVKERSRVKESGLQRVHTRASERENSLSKRARTQSREKGRDKERCGQTALIVGGTNDCGPR